MVLFYLMGWQKISVFKSFGKEPKTKLTVVVPAKDEEDNIGNLLNALKAQDYPSELYEVIIVNDHSKDNTPFIVEGFDMPNLNLIHLEDFVNEKEEFAFKKLAVQVAVDSSKGDLIVTTDADCVMGPYWLHQIAEFYEETKAKFIVAPVDYSPISNTLSILQNLDFLSMMGATGASVNYRLFNLSNGANMAYERATFLEVNGYENDQAASGDDVFLIEKVGSLFPDDVHYLKNRDAIVYTKPCPNLYELFQQRMRWISKTKHYKDVRTKLMAFLMLMFYLSLFGSFVLSFKNKQFLNIFLVQIIIKWIVDFALVNEVSTFFKKRKLLSYYPLIALVHFPFTFIVSIASQFFKYKWKNRKIKA